MENVFDTLYNTLLVELEEIEPEIIDTDDSFDYSYGSIRGTQKEYSREVVPVYLRYERKNARRLLEPVLDALMENIDLNKDGLYGYMDYKIDKGYFYIYLSWKFARN